MDRKTKKQMTALLHAIIAGPALVMLFLINTHWAIVWLSVFGADVVYNTYVDAKCYYLGNEAECEYCRFLLNMSCFALEILLCITVAIGLFLI